MKFCRTIFVRLFLTLFSAACATIEVPESFVYQEIETPDFDFAVWQKISDSTAEYRIYIEGDGYAFNSSGQPTFNPTPRGTFVRETAFGDTNPNVIYMARVCQFIQHKKCAQQYWTTARFAPEVVEAEAEAIKQIAQNRPVILISFSGGAQIAGLIAATHPEIMVQKVITIAGNLDHPAWTKHHQVPSLSSSMDLNDYADTFAGIPQVHYVGSKDEVMPSFLNQNFVTDKSTIIEVEGATHNDGWETIIPDIYNIR